MSSKRQRLTPFYKSCPNSEHKIKEAAKTNYNPQFDQLSSKTQTLPYMSKSETQPLTPQAVRDLLNSTVSNNFQTAFPDFDSMFRRWVLEQWKETRMNLQGRLTKVRYLEPTLVFENFAVIQKEVKVEWRKNHLLKGFTYMWIHVFKSHTFKSHNQLKQYYNAFCRTFETVSYILFRRSFKNLISKGFEVRPRLLRQTSIAVVTSLKQWREVYNNKISPFFLQKVISFSQDFQISSIEMNPQILNVDSKRQQFCQTKKSLQALIESLTLDEMVENLLQFRSNLITQIQQSIQYQSKHKKDNKHLTVQKQDVLGCIIYTLVKYKLDGLGVTLEYLSFLLGEDIDEVLRWRKVDCFKTDLQAAYWFVTQPVVKIEFMPQLIAEEQLA